MEGDEASITMRGGARLADTRQVIRTTQRLLPQAEDESAGTVPGVAVPALTQWSLA